MGRGGDLARLVRDNEALQRSGEEKEALIAALNKRLKEVSFKTAEQLSTQQRALEQLEGQQQRQVLQIKQKAQKIEFLRSELQLTEKAHARHTKGLEFQLQSQAGAIFELKQTLQQRQADRAGSAGAALEARVGKGVSDRRAFRDCMLHRRLDCDAFPRGFTKQALTQGSGEGAFPSQHHHMHNKSQPPSFSRLSPSSSSLSASSSTTGPSGTQDITARRMYIQTTFGPRSSSCFSAPSPSSSLSSSPPSTTQELILRLTSSRSNYINFLHESRRRLHGMSPSQRMGTSTSTSTKHRSDGSIAGPMQSIWHANPGHSSRDHHTRAQDQTKALLSTALSSPSPTSSSLPVDQLSSPSRANIQKLLKQARGK